MRNFYYPDEDGTLVPTDLYGYADWLAARNGDKHLDYDEIGDFAVSTVFLGYDHSRSLELSAPPILWETMIFFNGAKWNGYKERYSTQAKAQNGHRRACAIVTRHLQEMTARR